MALSVGLFLVGGMLLVLQQDSRAFAGQNDLAGLQDNERLAMTLVADVVQASGYFPDPTLTTAAGALPVTPGFPIAGQAVNGVSGPNPPGDTLTVRFATASGDGVLNCSGAANNSGANQIYVNSFFVAGNQLQCAMNGANFVLAN
ncbi:MAG: pilus assembly protein, partial [Gammaproteobacteria bacterium]|nr:pilus assembly protein [Gammaproteobacteria bacterium]